MKLSKSLIIATLVAGSLFAGSAVLQAQTNTNMPPAGPRGPGMRGGGSGVDAIATTLKLDDATKAKVKTIIDAQQKKISELRADTALSPEDRRTKMLAIRDETATQMKAVLTADQFDQWQKMNQPRLRRGAPAAAPAAVPAAAPVAAPAAAPTAAPKK
jgi:Spy/CpxP family protein refolding chaperone